MTPAPVPASPTAADWLTAWSTLGAAVGTVGTLLLGLWLWWRSRSRERRQQARLVHGWRTIVAASPPASLGDRIRLQDVITNDSDEPIYRVLVPRPGGPSAIFVIIGPRSQKTIELSDEENQAAGLMAAVFPQDWPIPFEFDDADSIGWTRAADGRLYETNSLRHRLLRYSRTIKVRSAHKGSD